MPKLNLGVAGLGRAFALMRPTLVADERVRLVAAADPRPEARAAFSAEFGGTAYPAVEALCEDPSVDVVYIATPHQFHAQHACCAAAAGKHLLVEKPMALSLEECRAMTEAARAANVRLVVGHSHSFDAPIGQLRRLIESGAVGRLRMITALNFTDFLYRPRRPEELDSAQGGGAVYNQGSHQVDIARLLGGGVVKTVRAATGNWDPARPTEGAYSAFLTFDNGAFASLTYSGYARFDSDEFLGWIGESGLPKNPDAYGATRAALEGVEAQLKAERNYGGARHAPLNTAGIQHQHFGVLIASCERADLRPLSNGVMVYGDRERRLEALPPPRVHRAEVIDELYAAVVEGKPPLHGGEWAAATLEVCLAILRSAREGKEIALENQTALRT